MNDQEISKISSKKLYGFTLKETYTSERYLTEATYTRCLNEIRRRGTVIDFHFEKTKADGRPARLHVHGIVDFSRIPKLTTICPKTFSTKFERIYNLEGWTKYCKKQEERFDNKILIC